VRYGVGVGVGVGHCIYFNFHDICVVATRKHRFSLSLYYQLIYTNMNVNNACILSGTTGTTGTCPHICHFLGYIWWELYISLFVNPCKTKLLIDKNIEIDKALQNILKISYSEVK